MVFAKTVSNSAAGCRAFDERCFMPSLIRFHLWDVELYCRISKNAALLRSSSFCGIGEIVLIRLRSLLVQAVESFELSYGC